MTIDGPAGAGKSTAAHALAKRLGFDFLDTGAMYRAVTLAALRAGVSPRDDAALATLLESLDVVVSHGKTTINGEDVSTDIRTVEVTDQVRHFADHGLVRNRLTAMQRKLGETENLVTEGRDQGTVVFPHAEIKLYLTASEEVRAQRRRDEYLRRGRNVPLETVLDEQRARDDQDSNRSLAPLKPADDARIIDTSNLDHQGTVDLLERLVREVMASS
ncbi:MAG: (d)CMP kinase [Planctomycetota bacterium]